MTRRKIDAILSPNRRSELARLLSRASLQEAWTAALRAFLPAELCSECQVANVRDHVVTVHVSNAAWATRLRFLIPDLLPGLNQLADFAAVREIRIKVAPMGSVSASPPDIHVDQRQPPDGAVLSKFADDLDYGELREAILRLARQGQARPGAQPGGNRSGPTESGE